MPLNTTSCFSRCLWVDAEASRSVCEAQHQTPLDNERGRGSERERHSERKSERGHLSFAAHPEMQPHSGEPVFTPQLGN